MIAVKRPLFELGTVVATPAAIETLQKAATSPMELLTRHVNGDFGQINADDWQLNQDAISEEARILSAYELKTGEKLWVITEADRSSTCLLLPEEY
jgi:hypothetical protein